MPTTYAHYRFGKSVLKKMTEKQQACIQRNRKLYDLGLHGPDVLFYYKALKKNPVNQRGFATHDRTGAEVFAQGAEVLNSLEGRQKDAARAYLYGYLCHFALDSNCHPYVEEMVRAVGLTHSKIEAEFDRFLMEKDGLDPLRIRPTGHLAIWSFGKRAAYARCMALFFPGITAVQAEKAIRSIRFYCDLLGLRGPAARRLLVRLMRWIRCSENMRDMVILPEKEEACRVLNYQLTLLYRKAISEAAALAANLDAYMEGKEELDKRLNLKT